MALVAPSGHDAFHARLATRRAFAALLLALPAGLAACRRPADEDDGPNQPEPTSGTDGDPGTEQPGTQRVDPPEGTTVVGFRYYHMGMYTGPYYSIRQVEAGFVCAEAGGNVYWPAMDGDDMRWYQLSDDGTYGFDRYGADPLAEDAYHSAVLLDDNDMAEFTELLAENGVFGWDGFDEAWYPPEGMEVTDTGETVDMQVLLSDGTHVSIHGVDTEPAGFSRAVSAIMDWFDGHADWSHFYPTQIPDSQVRRLTIEFLPRFYRPGASDFKIELVRGYGRWAVLLRDGRGEFLDKGTDIGDYGDVEDPDNLPFDRFLDILRTYDVASWNGREDYVDDNDECWLVDASFENGQMIRIDSNDYPAWYGEFREAVIREIIAYYDEVRED